MKISDLKYPMPVLPAPRVPEPEVISEDIKAAEVRRRLIQGMPIGPLPDPTVMVKLHPGLASAGPARWGWAREAPRYDRGCATPHHRAWGLRHLLCLRLLTAGSETRLPMRWLGVFTLLFAVWCGIYWFAVQILAPFRNCCMRAAHPWLAVVGAVLLFLYLMPRASGITIVAIMGICFLVYYPMTHPLRRTFVPIGVLAALCAWVSVSLIADFWQGRTGRAIPTEADRKKWRDTRATWVRDWKGPNVAVAISSGGYRRRSPCRCPIGWLTALRIRPMSSLRYPAVPGGRLV